MVWFYLFLFFVSCIFLAKSSTWLIQSLIRISQFLRWKEFVVSFILMAFASSLPELFVGVSSALKKMPELSFGNVIGANIINLTLVIGVSAILAKGLKMESHVAQKDSLYTAFIAILPVIALLDGVISRADAVILILVTLFYFSQVFSQKDIFSKIFKNGFERRTKRLRQKFFLDILIFFVSVVLLMGAAEGVTRSAVFFAEYLNLPIIFIGIILVAMGTALPELVFGVKSVLMGRKTMVIGNIMGCVVVTSSLVLGVVSLISPIEVSNFSPYMAGMIFIFISAIAFYLFARNQEYISKREGQALILIYVLFVLFEVLTQVW